MHVQIKKGVTGMMTPFLLKILNYAEAFRFS